MKIVPSVEGEREVKALLAELGKQAPIGLRLWQNNVGEHMQNAQRAGLPQRFRLRGTGSGFSQSIVFAKATPQQRNAVLKVGNAGTGQSRTAKLGGILARHEEGSERQSSASVRTSSGQTLAAGFFIPSGALRTNTTNPPRSLYPKAVGAVVRLTANGSIYAKSVRKGKKGKAGESYVVTERGIFRYRHDVGFGSSLPEPLWWFSKRVRTPARLRLWETAQSVFDRFAVAYAAEAVDLVIERSR